MRADLRNAVRFGAGTGAAGRALPLAVLLTVLVIVAAGLAGTADFTGPRWYPHIHAGNSAGVRTHTVTKIIPGGRKAPAPKPGSGFGWEVVTVPVVVIVLVAAYLLWRWFRGRRRGLSAPPLGGLAADAIQVATPEPEPEPARLLTGIELALRALDEQREPADAVVRAWLGLQQTAEESGIVRGASETPTEFASRVLTRAFADAQPLRTLLRLYLRTRFGDHPVTADDITVVRDALEQLLASWRATDGASATAERLR